MFTVILFSGKRKAPFTEFSDHKPQAMQSLDDSIIPEPYNFNYHLDTALAHQSRRKRMSMNCNDRYLLFMLDTSGSIGKKTFTRMVSNLSQLVPLFCGNTKIAAMTFGSHIYHEFCFKCDVNNGQNIFAMEEAIKSIPYHGGWTHTGEAVKCACDNILTIPCGLPKRKEYRKCPAPIDVVIITDGKSNGDLDVCEEVKCFGSHNFYDISTFSIGIGNTPDTDELKCIQDLDQDNTGHIFFDIENFEELEELIKEVIEYLSTPIDPSSDNPTYHLCYDLNDPLQNP